MTKFTDEQLAAWNEAHPVGTPMLAWPGAREEAPRHSYLDYAATNWPGSGFMAWVRGLGNIRLSHLARSPLDPVEHGQHYRQETLQRLRELGRLRSDEVARLAQETLPRLRDSALFVTLPDAQLDFADNIVELALWQQMRVQADYRISTGVSLLLGRDVSWPRPAALDHRQHVRQLFRPAQLPAVRAELAKWLHGRPARQPYKPEIVAEELVEGEDMVWVTFAVQDATTALRLGMNLARLEQEGGEASG
jgi:hypothetical protein